MKTPLHSNWNNRIFLPLLASALWLPGQVQAATTYYWDADSTNGNVLDAGSGSWNANTSNTVWTTSTTSIVDTYWTSGTANSVIFGGASAAAGSYVISVSSSGVYLQNMTFNSSGYILTAATPSTINIGSSNAGFLALGTGVVANIGDGITVISGSSTGSQPLTISGTGTLTISASSAGMAATVKTLSNNNVNIAGGATVVVGTNGSLQTGTGTASPYVAPGTIVVGATNSTYTTANATLTVNGGLVSNFNNFVIANSANNGLSTVNLESGTIATFVSNGLVRFGPGSGGTTSGTGVLNIDGGTLSIGGISVGTAGSAAYYLNLNGGVVKATQSTVNFMNSSSQLTAKVLGGAVFDTNGYNITIAQALVTGSTSVNDGGLTKQGNGTLTLTGANTYTGATTVKSGSLVVGASGNISSTVVLGASGGLSGTVDVSLKGASYSLANLSGHGTLIGAASSTITATGAVAPGINVGELDVSANFTLAGTAATSMEISGNGGIAGTDSDYLNVTGILTYGGSLVISSYNGYDLTQAGTYNLFDFTSSSGDFSSVTVGGVSLTKSGEVWSNSSSQYSFNENDGVLTVAAVPEPSTYAILVSGLGMLGLLRRKSRV